MGTKLPSPLYLDWVQSNNLEDMQKTRTKWKWKKFLNTRYFHSPAKFRFTIYILHIIKQISPTRPHWTELFIESPCPFVCATECCFFRGLSLALRSHDQIRPLIGQPSFPTIWWWWWWWWWFF